LRLQSVQVIRQGKRITTQAPRFRDPKNGVWVPAVILPDELQAAIARECRACCCAGPAGGFRSDLCRTCSVRRSIS
jgi:hypothetical protein